MEMQRKESALEASDEECERERARITSERMTSQGFVRAVKEDVLSWNPV